MIRFLFGPFRWAVGSEALAVLGAVWAHPILVRGIRVFPHRVRPVRVLSGRVIDTDPILDG